jgi:multiple sugar transport system ATP-binding protein
MSALSIENVVKRFGKTEVLKGVNASIESGGFLVLVGPSGCGKSTLLSLIAGLEPIDEGTISLAGQSINSIHPSNRDIAMVFQSYALYPTMTVRDNMAFALEMRGMAKEERFARVDAVAKMLKIDHLLERRPKQLSGGQRQRVAMGRALVRKPQVFLFDEPLSNLDAKLRVDMRTEIKRLHQELRTTTVYVTHDQVEALTLATKIAVMNQGRIEQLGTRDDIYHRPATTFVATFMGSPAMNLLPVQAYTSGNVAKLRLAADIELPYAGAIPSDVELLLGIRPESLQLGIGPGWQVNGVVEIVEHAGSDIFAHVRIGPHDVAVRLPGDFSVTTGQKLALRIDPSRVSVFDASSGARINN